MEVRSGRLSIAGAAAEWTTGRGNCWTLDNWQECTQTCRGVMARRVPINNQMGLGHERFDPAFGALVSDSGFSESNHRQFYRRWAELMGTAG